MKDRLDELLTDARPRSSADIPEVRRELDSMVEAIAERSRVRRRNRRNLARGMVALGALTLGGTAAAAATPGLLSALGWTPDVATTVILSGEVCDAEFKIHPSGSREGESDPAVLAARDYLLSLDLDAANLAIAREDLRERGVDLAGRTEAEQEMDVFNHWVVAGVFDELQRLGYDRERVSIESAYRCDEEES